MSIATLFPPTHRLHDLGELRLRGLVINLLGQCVSRFENLDNVPLYVREIIEGGLWREWEDEWGHHHTHESFVEFVEADFPRGLHTTPKNLLNMVRYDDEVYHLLSKELRRPPGGRHDTEEGRDNITSNPTTNGTSKLNAHRKLEKEGRHDLIEKVIGGELSAHAAMVEAGFRGRVIQLTPRMAADPKLLAAKLIAALAPDVVAGLIRELSAAQDAQQGHQTPPGGPVEEPRDAH